MKRVAVFGSMAEFESFVNDPKVSVIQVTVNSCQQSYNFQECFIGVVFYEDAPLNTAESPATDSQQLKAEIRAMCIELECTTHEKFDSGMYHALRGRLRELSVV